MKRLQIQQYYGGILLIIGGLVVLHAPISVGLGTIFPESALLIKAWKELLLVVAMILAIIAVQHHHAWHSFVHDRLLQLILAFAGLHIVSLWQWNGLLATLSGFAIDLRFLLYFALVYIWLQLYPNFSRRYKKIIIIGAGIVVVFATLQLFLPPDALKVLGYSSTTITPYTTVDQNPDFIRYQSTLRGPNPLGAYLVGVISIGSAYLFARRKYSDWRLLVFAALSLLALYNTHSRSAYIATGIALLILMTIHYGKKLKRWHYTAAAALLIGIGALTYTLRSTDFVSNVILHEDPEEPGKVNSNEGHVSSLVSGTMRMLQQPLGEGIGSTGSASLLSDTPRIIENHYLVVAHEVGWLGLALFITIYCVVMVRLWKMRSDTWALGMFASGVGLAVIGLLLPVWVDDTVSLVWWGMAAVVLAQHPRKR